MGGGDHPDPLMFSRHALPVARICVGVMHLSNEMDETVTEVTWNVLREESKDTWIGTGAT